MTNETTADIIAEMRALSNPISDGIIAINGRIIADRLEAAYKREKAAIEADALSVGGLVEAMRQKEAICTKCRDGEPPKNCQFFGEPDGCSSPTYGHYPQLPIGNAAKLREALENAAKQLIDATEDKDFGDDVMYLVGCMRTVSQKCRAALAATEKEGGDDGE